MQAVAGVVVLASLYVLLGVGYVLVYRASRVLNLAQGDLMMVGGYALFATVTTDASCGAINSWHDSFTPLGGLEIGRASCRERVCNDV